MRTLANASSNIFLHTPISFFFFFNDTATTEIYTLSLHDALPIYIPVVVVAPLGRRVSVDLTTHYASGHFESRSEEHTSELQSQSNLVCRLLLEKKKIERFATHARSHRRRRVLCTSLGRSMLYHTL